MTIPIMTIVSASDARCAKGIFDLVRAMGKFIIFIMFDLPIKEEDLRDGERALRLP